MKAKNYELKNIEIIFINILFDLLRSVSISAVDLQLCKLFVHTRQG